MIINRAQLPQGAVVSRAKEEYNHVVRCTPFLMMS